MKLDLKKRVALLERKLAAAERRTSASDEQADPTLASAIEDVERRIRAMSYMDEEELMEEPTMNYMDEDELIVDDEMEPGCGGMEASEMSPGIEDQITQDYLDDVEALRPGADTRETAPSMLDVAPTEYTARLMKASGRLDRVAAYLEENGRKDMALRIDKIADAIDSRIKGGRQ
jgi:hypothetical protein